MKRLMYSVTQKMACFGLYCYYREMQLHGMHKVPRNRAVMFLANHQNALLDPLVIAAFTPFRPYFLTRGDIFINPVVNRIFSFLRMLPVYRMRDGRSTLARNEEIFEDCTQLLEKGEYILLFPEANHNIMRRVRPLSKGFTRILFATLDKDPDLDVLLIPVGINYENASTFPDRVSFYFGDPISSREHYDQQELARSVEKIKNMVSDALKTKTTHIDETLNYSQMHNYLYTLGVDFLDPAQTNEAIRQYPVGMKESINKRISVLQKILRGVFLIINFPVILIWRGVLKPKILEVEFISTFRFAYAVVAQPLFYLILWWVCYTQFNTLWASFIVLCHFLLSLLYVKYGRSVSSKGSF